MGYALSALHGFDSFAPVDLGRRGVPADAIRDAELRRARGIGWQTIANIWGVNVLDLRRACNDPTLPPEFRPEPAPAKAKASKRMRAKPGERQLAAMLEAIEAGAGSGGEIYQATQLGHGEVGELLAVAREQGLVEGGGRAKTMRLTEAGHAWLEARRG